MPKLPPIIRHTESLRFYASRRMLWLVTLVALTILLPAGATTWLRPPAAVAVAPPLSVPQLESTTDGTPRHSYARIGALPSPGPNQKRAGSCNPKAAQVEINDGCWVKTEQMPPCPEGFQWEHEGRCWLPVAHARPIPTTGDVLPVTVAE
jgi:hypothetical protein